LRWNEQNEKGEKQFSLLDRILYYYDFLLQRFFFTTINDIHSFKLIEYIDTIEIQSR